MVKRKSPTSLFATLAQQIDSEAPSAECHLIDNEYFAAFHSLDDIQQFHQRLVAQQSTNHDEEEEEGEDQEMDMKTFAQQYLIDLPEPTSTASTQESTPVSSVSTRKRQRRNVRDLPQSSNFIFMSDDDRGIISESLWETKSASRSKRIAYEDMSSILLTLDMKQKRKKPSTKHVNAEAIIAVELAEPSLIKSEPHEQEQVRCVNQSQTHHSCSFLQLVITHVVEAKDEPVDINVRTRPSSSTHEKPLLFHRLFQPVL